MTFILPEEIERYCVAHSAPASALADKLAEYTTQNCAAPQMLTGAWEGALLRMLVEITGARRALEIGTFTGYSALSMAEGLSPGGTLITCEIDPKNAEIARNHLDRTPHGRKVTIKLGPALDTLKSLAPPFDFVFIDADKENYGNYFEECLRLLRPGGLIAADNVLWSGRVLDPKEASDRAIAAFNDNVAKDPRVECVMLPIRDGVSLIRKL
jgi:predicted O-methyltransferase YrrM